MKIRTGLLGALLVLGLVVTGCGGDDSDKKSDSTSTTEPSDSADSGDDSGDDASSSGPLDVCGLLTTADLQREFGSPFGEGELTHQDETGADQCVWTNTDVPPVKTFSLTVLRQGALGGSFKAADVKVEKLHADSKAAFPDAEELDLGDDSYISGTTLAVLKGDTEYTFNTVFGTSATAIEGMKKLAAQVVG
jgi:hypothetical protein